MENIESKLNELIDTKLKQLEILANYVKDNKPKLEEAKKDKKISVEAYRVSTAARVHESYRFQLGALLKIKSDLGFEVEEKFKPLIAIDSLYLDIDGDNISFKGEEIVNKFIEAKEKADNQSKQAT